jgi:fructokinase
LPGPLQQAYTPLLQKAVEHNVFISFDPNYRHLLFNNNTQSFIEQSWHFINQCHFFKVSDEEAILLTGAVDVAAAAAQLLQKTKAIFAITLGKEGTLLGLNGNLYTIPSITIQAVDTTGAGDAFVGAILYQLTQMHDNNIHLLEKDSWEKIIHNANKAGARTCEYLGAMEAFKHLNNDIFK